MHLVHKVPVKVRQERINASVHHVIAHSSVNGEQPLLQQRKRPGECGQRNTASWLHHGDLCIKESKRGAVRGHIALVPVIETQKQSARICTDRQRSKYNGMGVPISGIWILNLNAHVRSRRQKLGSQSCILLENTGSITSIHRQRYSKNIIQRKKLDVSLASHLLVFIDEVKCVTNIDPGCPQCTNSRGLIGGRNHQLVSKLEPANLCVHLGRYDKTGITSFWWDRKYNGKRGKYRDKGTKQNKAADTGASTACTTCSRPAELGIASAAKEQIVAHFPIK